MNPTDPRRDGRTASESLSQTGAPPAAPTPHDYVLALVPLVLLVGALSSALAGVGIRTGVVAGAAAALVVVGYALFGMPPTGREGGGGTAL